MTNPKPIEPEDLYAMAVSILELVGEKPRAASDALLSAAFKIEELMAQNARLTETLNLIVRLNPEGRGSIVEELLWATPIAKLARNALAYEDLLKEQ